MIDNYYHYGTKFEAVRITRWMQIEGCIAIFVDIHLMNKINNNEWVLFKPREQLVKWDRWYIYNTNSRKLLQDYDDNRVILERINKGR